MEALLRVVLPVRLDLSGANVMAYDSRRPVALPGIGT